MLKNFSLNRMLVLITTIGFSALLIDTTMEHWEVFSEELMAYIPFVYCLTAIILGTITLIKWKIKIIRIFRIYLILSFIVAIGGLYFHIEEEDDEDEINYTIQDTKLEEKENEKPLLAPLSFGGLAVFGLIGTTKKWQSESLENLI